MKMNKSDKINTIIDVKRRFLSECTVIPSDKTILSRKIRSDPDLESNTNYDDICGPWKFDTVSLHSRCSYLSSKFIMPEDVMYMRKQQDKKSILLFLERKIPHDKLFKDGNKNILVKLLWQIFKFFKEKLFTDQQISTIIELMLSTHNFYLTNYWNTIEETYKYFFERVLLCTVMDPPRCMEIFTPNQVQIILEFFHEIYLENIVLLHLVYMTHYCIVLKFGDTDIS